MKPDEDLRIEHMVEAGKQAMALLAGRSVDELESNLMLGLAVVKAIETMGEAANHVTAECRQLQPEIPWQRIVGMRNVLIHEYFQIRVGVVWAVVTQELPEVVRLLDELLERLRT